MAESKMYPAGTKLASAKWGECVLVRASSMKPGTKCQVRWAAMGARPTWRPAEDFKVPAGVPVAYGKTPEPNQGGVGNG